MNKTLSTVWILSLVAGAYLSLSPINANTPVAIAAEGNKVFNGTLYVAGWGGHFSVADVTINPNNDEAPITVNSVDMLDIGGKGYPTCDARIDAKDRNTMYWSTYKLDTWKDKGAIGGNLHVGKVDLKSGEVTADVAFAPPARAKWTRANYCASGQSHNSYIAVSAANEGYIDVYDKKTMKLKHRVFFDGLGIKAGETTYAHGINTPDMKKFLLTLNLTPRGFTKWSGNSKLIYLDMAALEQGQLVQLQETTIEGLPKDASGGTITFRQNFTPDGKYLLQSGFDRGYLIDAETLEVLDNITPLPGMVYDFAPTPDGKHAVMALREKTKDFEGNDSIDGTVLLYDVEKRKTIGKSASVCFACHKGKGVGRAILGGLDANWK
jgi:WD40 repeat protein